MPTKPAQAQAVLRAAPAHYFVASSKAITDTLFAPIDGVTAKGFYRKTRGGIRFHDCRGEAFAFLVANRYGERFFVSCSKDVKGRFFFMFGLSEKDGYKLGISDLSCSAEAELASRLWDQLN